MADDSHKVLSQDGHIVVRNALPAALDLERAAINAHIARAARVEQCKRQARREARLLRKVFKALPLRQLEVLVLTYASAYGLEMAQASIKLRKLLLLARKRKAPSRAT